MYWGHDLDLLGSRDVMCHVTTGFPMCGFLLVVNMNGPCISHGCRDIELQRYLGYDLDLLGSRDVICHVTSVDLRIIEESREDMRDQVLCNQLRLTNDMFLIL